MLGIKCGVKRKCSFDTKTTQQKFDSEKTVLALTENKTSNNW